MVVVIADDSWETITDHLPSDVLAEVTDPTAEEEAVGLAASAHDRLDDVETRLDCAGTKRDHIEEQVHDLRDEFEARDTEAVQQPEEATTTIYEGVPGPELSNIERISHHGWDAVVGSPKKVDLHARVIFEALPEWGKRTNDGALYLEATRETIEKLAHRVGTMADGDLADKDQFSYEEVYRAFRRIAEQSDGKVTFKDGHRTTGGRRIAKHLRIPYPEDVALPLGR